MTGRLQRFQSGFGIVGALFITVVLAGLAITIAYLSGQQHMASALDERGVRAYLAARSGLEWGIYQVRIAKNGAACFDTNPSRFSFPSDAPSLEGYSVSVSCSASGATFAITATACSPAASGNVCPNPSPPATYVERQLSALVGR